MLINFFEKDHKVITWSGGLDPSASYSCGKHPADTHSTKPLAFTSPLPHCSKVPSANSLLTAH